jgi:hypothetical protein
MLEDESFYLPTIGRLHVVTECFPDFETFTIKPILAFCIRLLAMNMNWLITFVGVEENPSTSLNKYCRH